MDRLFRADTPQRRPHGHALELGCVALDVADGRADAGAEAHKRPLSRRPECGGINGVFARGRAPDARTVGGHERRRLQAPRNGRDAAMEQVIINIRVWAARRAGEVRRGQL